MNSEMKTLAGEVAVFTGATRNAERGIAIELGAAGATVRQSRGIPKPRSSVFFFLDLLFPVLPRVKHMGHGDRGGV
jgi:hypothetical protein